MNILPVSEVDLFSVCPWRHCRTEGAWNRWLRSCTHPEYTQDCWAGVPGTVLHVGDTGCLQQEADIGFLLGGMLVVPSSPCNDKQTSILGGQSWIAFSRMNVDQCETAFEVAMHDEVCCK